MTTPTPVPAPPNPQLPRIGAWLFALFAIGFVLATVVGLADNGIGALHADSNVLLYALSPVPMLVLGALACLRVTPETYQRWMLAFLLLFLLWAVGGATALVRVDNEETVVVFLHLLIAGAGATSVFLVRGVARQRGLRI